VDRGVVIRENVNPQHGSFMQITKEEYDLLETWSDLYLKTQELAGDKKTAKKAKKLQAVLDRTFTENAVPQLLNTYAKALKELK